MALGMLPVSGVGVEGGRDARKLQLDSQPAGRQRRGRQCHDQHVEIGVHACLHLDGLAVELESALQRAGPEIQRLLSR